MTHGAAGIQWRHPLDKWGPRGARYQEQSSFDLRLRVAAANEVCRWSCRFEEAIGKLRRLRLPLPPGHGPAQSATVFRPHPTWRRPGPVSFRGPRSSVYSMRRGALEPAVPASNPSAATVQGHGRRCLCGTSPSPQPCFWHKATNPRGLGTVSPRATEVCESRMSHVSCAQQPRMAARSCSDDAVLST